MTSEKWIQLPVEKLVKADWNYKTEDEEKSRVLRNNIKRNGQIENILVRELDTGFYEVVNGNHRYDVFIQLGLSEVMCFNLGKISFAQAKRIAVETNETKFENDQLKLAELLRELDMEFGTEDLVSSLPFSEQELDNFKKLLEFDFDSLATQPPEGKTQILDNEDWKTVTLRLPEGVAQQLTDQIDRFKRALHPEEPDLNAISPVMAVEAMIQHIAQLEDTELV